QKEVEKKKVEQKLAFEMGKAQSFLQQVTARKRKLGPPTRFAPRRPRQSRRGAGLQQTSGDFQEDIQSPFLSRATRGRGRGRGRGRVRGRGRGRGSRGRGFNQTWHA